MKKDPRKLIRYQFLFLIAALALSTASLAAPALHQVTTSIKPLALMVRSLLPPEIKVNYLVPDNANPHAYQLKPSDLAKLTNSDWFIWVGPDMEVFLERLISNASIPTLALEESGAHAGEAGHGDSGHVHADGDPHIWLDPLKAIEASEKIVGFAETRFDMRPDSLEQMKANLRRLREGLNNLTRHPGSEAPPALNYYSRHDAFSGLGRFFGRPIHGFITITPEQTAGISGLKRVMEAMRSASASCYLSEKGLKDPYVRLISSLPTVSVVYLDVRAVEADFPRSTYLDYMRKLAREFITCRNDPGQP